MPRICHANAAYGCGHHAEHVEAARKGWETRRGHGPVAALRRSERILSDVFGEKVTGVHTHKTHRGEVRFKMGGKWASLPRREFFDMVKNGEYALRQREREEKKAEKARISEEKRAARLARADEGYAEAMERMMEADQRRDYARVRKTLRKLGVRPSFVRATGRQTLASEYRALPSDIRRRNGRIGLDGVREILYEEGAITEAQLDEFTERDAIEWLERMADFGRTIRERRAQRAARRSAA